VNLGLVAAVASAAEVADHAAPLDEATWRSLRREPDSFSGTVRDDAFVLRRGTDLHLVVTPAARSRGLGGDLLASALASYDGVLQAWSHGDHPAAALLAARHDFERVRDLWVMRRPMSEPLPPSVDGTAIRSWRDGDAAEVLRVNAAAFAGHPEQGAMDAADLAARMAEPWFDPDGLLVAVEGDRVLGFHWTKQDSATLGEVYVVGIDPTAQGRGLGRAMTLAGLHPLADRGVEEVLLYVESDNAAAIRTYRGLGFAHHGADTHVLYRRG
jgi:mycothiol synthase